MAEGPAEGLTEGLDRRLAVGQAEGLASAQAQMSTDDCDLGDVICRKRSLPQPSTVWAIPFLQEPKPSLLYYVLLMFSNHLVISGPRLQYLQEHNKISLLLFKFLSIAC